MIIARDVSGRHANDLAREIRAYWAAKGFHNVVTRIEALHTRKYGHSHPFSCIRSDMVNGLPRAVK